MFGEGGYIEDYRSMIFLLKRQWGFNMLAWVSFFLNS